MLRSSSTRAIVGMNLLFQFPLSRAGLAAAPHHTTREGTIEPFAAEVWPHRAVGRRALAPLAFEFAR